MKGIIHVGGITTRGRTVLSGSVVVKFAIVRAAREEDPVLYPIPEHRRTVTAKRLSNV
ncbi:hypothetical protein [Pseudomonas silesiensis]|jgi:hypothetical protein|uniref:hypothetical protein n=1 Tax=Pseudomonas silesiensis TaxID=1853130 RepID=UPI001F1AD623|nr:hypothetical protein [Pseudomonas silesiensis]